MQRLIIAYAIFTGGLVLICFGMNFNDSATPDNAAWIWISDLRNFCLITWMVPAAAIALSAAFEWNSTDKPKPLPVLLQPRETAEEAAAREERYRLHREEKQREWAAEQERMARKKEQERLRLEEEKRKVEETRKARTAEEAAKSALCDFL